MWVRATWALGIGLVLSGCGGAAAGAPRPAAASLVLAEQRITATDPAELPRLFREASDLLSRGEAAQAATSFERIAQVDPEGPTAAPSLYNAGIARAELGQLEPAARHFVESARRDPSAETTTLAWLRATRLFATTERWEDLDRAAREALSRPDLKLLQQIEARGALALALVSLGRDDDAYKVVLLARNQVEDHRLGESGTPPLELAQLAFALGEIRRVRGEKMRFVPVPADFGAALEARCTALLDAQNAYTDAMRSLDAHWSAMSGFRIGQLYAQLHADVMAVPAPPEATTERRRQLWEAAMHLRYRILLEKGLAMMEGTVRLGERTGERSAWIDRARSAKAELEATLSAERAKLAAMPFTEDEVRAALAQLQGKKLP
jgi:tetratricopeptide (TPR) repeat protein